ncbi:MAG: HAMP domain-containing protein [Armatimonadetes bacterium]|nr:HAMP domain-containing protein [Armatimonadota bacterium]
MRSLKVQLLVSHLLLGLLMAGVMGGALINFSRLGHSIEGILRDNYDSVIAAQNMKESLERQDSAATFFLAGQTRKARDQYQANWPVFQHWADVESHNITEVGEQQMSDDIEAQFPAYRRAIERLLYARPPMPPVRQRAYYFSTLEPAFLRLKQRAQDVLDVNQAAIVRADRRAKAEARRASLTGLGVTAAALLLALLLAGRTIRAVLTPLRTFARQAEEIGAGHLDQRIALPRQDEIGALAASFNDMAEKLTEARRLEEQRLHRAERMSDAALESLYDPVIVTDGSACVVHLNRAAEGLFGPARRAAGAPLVDVVREARITQAVDCAIHQERVSAGEGEAALIPLQVGGATRTYRLRATPMRDDDALLGAVAVLEDVTHLRELDRLKTEFIGVASHELRTPVTSLLLSVQLLQEGAVGELTPQQWEVVAAQREDLERLERMMRDLLDVTRLESGVVPPRFEIVPPRELTRSAVAGVSAQAQAKGVALREDVPEGLPDVRADRTQMMRVLLNLLGNALRHTPPGGTVTIRSHATQDSVTFTVEDTGVGIPKEYLPQIFDRFVQVPGATRGGAGLGLSIARTIVQAHGGDITAASELGRGSTFTVTLPAVPPAADETH